MIQIRVMTLADVSFGMRLKEQAGWNQVESDWRRLFTMQPDGCFIAELRGIKAGTVTTSRFGPVAWIAMMLVDEGFRGRGIGRALMSHALDYLDAHDVRSVRLDATPLGRPLYESLGFVAESILARHVGMLPRSHVHESISPAEITPRDGFARIAAFDFSATGTQRGQLLQRLFDEHPDSFHAVEEGGKITGYGLARPGSKAVRIGPCVATAPAGPLLLDQARRQYAGETVTLDIPLDNAPAIELVDSWGLTETSRLTRMTAGPRVAEHLELIWASAGPEKG